METHFILNVLGWILLLGSWVVYFFNKKKLHKLQLAMNIAALICFATNLILKLS